MNLYKKKIEPQDRTEKELDILLSTYNFLPNYIHPRPTSKRNCFKQEHLIDNFEEKYERNFVYTHILQYLHPGQQK